MAITVERFFNDLEWLKIDDFESLRMTENWWPRMIWGFKTLKKITKVQKPPPILPSNPGFIRQRWGENLQKHVVEVEGTQICASWSSDFSMWIVWKPEKMSGFHLRCTTRYFFSNRTFHDIALFPPWLITKDLQTTQNNIHPVRLRQD
jgi:hypothetical protein